MGTDTKSTTGREYLRVSLDRSGKQKSTTEQHDDNGRAATDRGVKLGKPYRDDGVSASRYSKKVRDDFELLLDDLQHGRFGADELWLWESSRGSRQVGEWVQLIEACERARVKIWVTTHNRLYDPANARDRRTLLEDAVDSEYESAKTSHRVLRDMAASAAAGRPHGKALYGYRRTYDPKTKELVSVEIDEDQADVLREMARRFLAGESMRSISLDLNDRKVPSPRGDWWHPSNPPRLLKNPAYHGERVHQGKVVGEAIWPAIFEDPEWRDLQAKLADPARNTRGNGQARYLLGGSVLTCGPCERDKVQRRVGVQVRRPRDYLSYQCCEPGRFCVARSVHQLDAFIEDVVVARFSRPDVIDVIATDDEEATRAAQQANDEAATLQARLDDFVGQGISGKLSPATVARAERELLPKIEAAEARAKELRVPAVVRDLVGADDVGARWDAYDMSRKREIIKASMTITLNRTRRGARTLDPTSVKIRWLV